MNSFVKNLGEGFSKNSPKILTGLGCAGVITTAVLTGRAVLKADRILRAEQAWRIEDGDKGPIPLADKAVLTWKVFLLPAFMGVSSIVFILRANTVNANRNAALAALYSLSDTALREYKEKVVEQIGRPAERKIRNGIAQDHAEKKENTTATSVIITGHGDVLCLDIKSKRPFRSSPEKIRQQVLNLNYTLMNTRWLDLNEFYYAIGLEECYLGSICGFDIDKGKIEVDYSSQLTPDGEPVLTINVEVYPHPNLRR